MRAGSGPGVLYMNGLGTNEFLMPGGIFNDLPVKKSPRELNHSEKNFIFVL